MPANLLVQASFGQEVNMRFVLHHSGVLKANGSPEHKHELRRHFHKQLAELWTHEPLKHITYVQLKSDDPSRQRSEKTCLRRERGAFTFVPVVAKDLKLVAAVEVFFLRPEPLGQLITQGGDIDNRLKTLFDALSVPQAGALPTTEQPGGDEEPFYCALEDDNLISSVTVHSEHLLTHKGDRNHAETFVRFNVERTTGTWGNSVL